jgi:tRNA (mo5U34)-methyltransferase
MTTANAGLQGRIRALGPWFHNLRLRGIETAPDHFLGDFPRCKWERIRDAIPRDLRGVSVLDIGCNGGFYALEMARRGAGPIVAIDSDARYLAQAKLAAEVENAHILFHQMSVYDVAELGRRFDLVLFMGVFYHLRHPLLALDLLREHVVGDALLFQSLQGGAAEVGTPAGDYAFGDRTPFDDPTLPRLHFVERSYAGDPTNWFIPNRAAVEALLRTAGFRPERLGGSDVYLCRPEDHGTDRTGSGAAA